MANRIAILSSIGILSVALIAVPNYHHAMAATNTATTDSGVTLSASQPLLRTGQTVALYATSPQPLSGGQTLEIVDQSTNQVVGATQSGSSLSAVWTTATAQLQTFQAKVTQESSPMTISWVDQGDGDNRGHTNAAGDTVSTSVPLTDTANTPITVTASGTGFTSPVYQFWYAQSDGQWVSSGSFAAKDTYTFTPPAGIVSVVAYAREASAPTNETATQSAQYEAKSPTETVTVAGSESSPPGTAPAPTTSANPDAWVGLNLTNQASVGTDMQLQASAAGITNPVYQFWFLSPGNQWESSGTYSAANAYEVSATGPGDWQVDVYARPASAPSNETPTERAVTTVESPVSTIVVHS